MKHFNTANSYLVPTFPVLDNKVNALPTAPVFDGVSTFDIEFYVAQAHLGLSVGCAGLELVLL